MIPTKTQAIARLQKAYDIAILTRNTKLADTLRPMILAEKAKSIKSSNFDGVNAVSKKIYAVTNPKKMAKKLKAERYDTRIELADEATIKARYESYKQQRLVFQRA